RELAKRLSTTGHTAAAATGPAAVPPDDDAIDGGARRPLPHPLSPTRAGGSAAGGRAGPPCGGRGVRRVGGRGGDRGRGAGGAAGSRRRRGTMAGAAMAGRRHDRATQRVGPAAVVALL